MPASFCGRVWGSRQRREVGVQIVGLSAGWLEAWQVPVPVNKGGGIKIIMLCSYSLVPAEPKIRTKVS